MQYPCRLVIDSNPETGAVYVQAFFNGQPGAFVELIHLGMLAVAHDIIHDTVKAATSGSVELAKAIPPRGPNGRG